MGRIVEGLKAAVFATGFGLAIMAQAVPIPTGTSSADDLIINFDFSSQTPSQPYASIAGVLNYFVTSSPSATLVVDAFSDLDGINLFGTSCCYFGSPGPFLSTFGIHPGMVDGQFSFGVRMIAGTADFVDGTATAFSAQGVPTPTIYGNVVPEPGTLALLGLGLAGIGFSRRQGLMFHPRWLRPHP